MDERATGIILRTRLLTDTSLIVHWLTSELGRLATVAKGARRPKSAFRGKLDLFYETDFSFTRSRRSDLHALREVVVRDNHGALRQNLAYLQQASYCAALIEQATETETPLPNIFVMIRGLLAHLPKQPAQIQTIFAFELKLLNELGLSPDLAKSKLAEGTKRIASVLLASDWPTVPRWKPSEAQAAELLQFLHGFLIFHLGKIPKGRTP